MKFILFLAALIGITQKGGLGLEDACWRVVKVQTKDGNEKFKEFYLGKTFCFFGDSLVIYGERDTLVGNYTKEYNASQDLIHIDLLYYNKKGNLKDVQIEEWYTKKEKKSMIFYFPGMKLTLAPDKRFQ
ncbi:MAG: hypothetical protein NT150_07130 [Bacteroidetes bacterium]|nr:hypothetical protein [Bacteroidota bacterium]